MKIWIPLSLIILLTVVAVGITFIARNKGISQPGLQTETVEVKLNLEPETNSVKVGDNVAFDLKVEVTNLRTVGVETYFTYDPQVLSITSIEPTGYFQNPQILTQNIDSQTGKISYAVGSLQPTLGSGIVYKINATVIGKGSTANIINFDKTNSKVALESADASKRYIQEETVVLFSEKPLNILP